MICKCGNSINVPSYLEDSRVKLQCDKCFNAGLTRVKDSSHNNYAVCEHCGALYQVKSGVKNKKYCSVSCRREVNNATKTAKRKVA